MISGATSDDVDSINAVPNLIAENLLKPHFACLVDSSGEAHTDNFWLFMDLFKHEMLIAALFRSGDIPVDMMLYNLNGLAIEVCDRDSVGSDRRHAVVFQIDDLSGVRQQGRNVARNHVFAITETDDEGTEISSCDKLFGLFLAENNKGKRAPHLPNSPSDSFLQWHSSGIFLTDDMGRDFGVGLAVEGRPFAHQIRFELGIILNDPVVDQRDILELVEMGMGVFVGGTTVGRPSAVGDSNVRVGNIVAESLAELGQFSSFFYDMS